MVLNTYLKKDKSLKIDEKASKLKLKSHYIMNKVKLKSRTKTLKDRYRNKQKVRIQQYQQYQKLVVPKAMNNDNAITVLILYKKEA